MKVSWRENSQTSSPQPESDAHLRIRDVETQLCVHLHHTQRITASSESEESQTAGTMSNARRKDHTDTRDPASHKRSSAMERVEVFLSTLPSAHGNTAERAPPRKYLHATSTSHFPLPLRSVARRSPSLTGAFFSCSTTMVMGSSLGRVA
jgi:hypothetical protein